jgi:hypothetical protein
VINPYVLAALAETRAADLRELAATRRPAREPRSSWRPRWSHGVDISRATKTIAPKPRG